MNRRAWPYQAALLALSIGLVGCGEGSVEADPDGSSLGFDRQADNEVTPPRVSDAERALMGTGSLSDIDGTTGNVARDVAGTLDAVGDAVQTGVEETGDAGADVTGAEAEVEGVNAGAVVDMDAVTTDQFERPPRQEAPAAAQETRERQ